MNTRSKRRPSPYPLPRRERGFRALGLRRAQRAAGGTYRFSSFTHGARARRSRSRSASGTYAGMGPVGRRLTLPSRHHAAQAGRTKPRETGLFAHVVSK